MSWTLSRRLLVLGCAGGAEALARHAHGALRTAPPLLRSPLLASARAVALAPAAAQASRWRGGTVGARRASTRASPAGGGPRMLTGAALSAAIIGGLNALGLAVTLANPAAGEKVTDLLGTGAIALGAIAVYLRAPAPLPLRAVLVSGAVVLWGVRLAGFLFYRVLHTGSDSRLSAYFETRASAAAFWATSALWGWLTALPQALLAFSPAAARPLGPFGALAAAVLLGALVAEAVADWQKWAFKQRKRTQDKWCDTGLWARCRHPNYAAELAVWTSVFALAAPGLILTGGTLLVRFGGVCAAALSPLFVSLIILKVSGVPIAEARSDKRFGHLEAYQRYKRETPLLVPRLTGKGPPPGEA